MKDIENQINRIEILTTIILAILICIIIYYIYKVKPLIDNANMIKINNQYLIEIENR